MNRRVTGAGEHQVVHHLKPDKNAFNSKHTSRFHSSLQKQSFQKHANRRMSSSSSTRLHTEDSFGVTLQRAQEQATPGVPHADGAVVGANQQQAAGALLGCAQAAHSARPVAIEHIQLLQSLSKERRHRDGWIERGLETSVSLLLNQSWPLIHWQVQQKAHSRPGANITPCLIKRTPPGNAGSGGGKMLARNEALLPF